MVLTWLRDIREHKWLALRAVAVGWMALVTLWIVVGWLVNLDEWLFVRGIANIYSFWPNPREPFFHFLIGGCVFAASGWIVGRTHRAHRAPMVIVFFLSILLISDLPQFVPAAIRASVPGNERFWEIVIMDFVFMRLPILAAGIWGVKS